jgi:hypothetical protein
MVEKASSTAPGPRSEPRRPGGSARWPFALLGILVGAASSVLIMNATGTPLWPDARRAPALPDARVTLAAFTAKLDAHAREARDQGWADPTTRSIRRTLEANTAGGFAVKALDCRTRSCVADLEWPSHAAASAGYRAAMTGFDLPCATEIVLPPPATPDRAYRARLHLACQR